MLTFRDGIEIKSYEELIKTTHRVILFEHNRNRVFMYGTDFNCPGMVNSETGEKFFGEDIKKFITFPLYRLKLVPCTKADDKRLDP